MSNERKCPKTGEETYCDRECATECTLKHDPSERICSKNGSFIHCTHNCREYCGIMDIKDITRICPKSGLTVSCNIYCDECNIPEKFDIKASCGMMVYAKDNYVCPYFSRPEEWKSKKGNHSNCPDIQNGSNVCLCALINPFENI